MRKSTVLEHFGTLHAIADALGISVSAVSQWDEIVPEGSAYKLQVVTGGVLQVNPRDYRTRPKRGQSLSRRQA